MAKGVPSAAVYRRRVLPENAALRRADPDLYRLVEQGLRSPEALRWREVAEALRSCSAGWMPFFREKASRDPRALCWMIAAGHYEGLMSGANDAPRLRKEFLRIPDVSLHLAELETEPDPWLSGMAAWGRRVLSGRDAWIGEKDRRRG
jgi:hypothetical protein